MVVGAVIERLLGVLGERLGDAEHVDRVPELRFDERDVGELVADGGVAGQLRAHDRGGVRHEHEHDVHVGVIARKRAHGGDFPLLHRGVRRLGGGHEVAVLPDEYAVYVASAEGAGRERIESDPRVPGEELVGHVVAGVREQAAGAQTVERQGRELGQGTVLVFGVRPIPRERAQRDEQRDDGKRDDRHGAAVRREPLFPPVTPGRFFILLLLHGRTSSSFFPKKKDQKEL